MNIAIIGTGNIGTALGKAWAKAGHTIFLGVRDLENFKGKEMLGIANVTVHSIGEAVKLSEVILIAAIPPATAEIVNAMGNVNGKIIIDTMNSVRSKPEGYNNTFEALTDLAKGAEVVKCFNSTGFENMANPIYPNDVHLDMFMAGDSKTAKETVKQLAKDVGFADCYDFGGNDKVILLEQFALAWINLAMMQGHGRNIAFKIIKR
jgi:predicted dinucleotide-binding enzyme